MLEFAEAPEARCGSRPHLMDLSPLAPHFLSAGSVLSDLARWLVHVPAGIFHAYSSLLVWVADSIHDLFDKYGYLVVFLGTLFENTLLLGLIIPGVIVILLAGINAHDGALNPFYAAALGILGAVLGDTISYLMGRFGWARLGNGESMRSFSEKVREPLLNRGAFFVLAYHFAGYTRLFGPTAAGLFRMPYRRWAPLDHLGAALWVSTFIAIGYGLGAAGITLDSTDKYFHYIEWGLLAVLGLWMVFVFRSSQAALLRQLTGGSDEDEDVSDEEPDDDEPETQPVGSGMRS
ncbi:MAG TPA: DedA family protein [Dehalococcoidia bacterium]